MLTGMSVNAKIKFVQGVTVGAIGFAIIGSSGTEVIASDGNAVPGTVATYRWTFLDVPAISSLPRGVVTQGNASSIRFTPDTPGDYHVQVEAWGIDGRRTFDRRVFRVLLPSGRAIPAFDAEADAMNFGGNARGWAPDMEAWFAALESGVAGGFGATVDRNGTGVLNDLSTMDGGSYAGALRMTGAAPSIAGLGQGADRRWLIVHAVNQTILQNEGGTSSAANRIVTGTGANLTLPAGSAALLAYDPFQTRWRVVSASSSGGVGLDGLTTKAMADADQTLSAGEVAKPMIKTTGALTANRNLVFPAPGAASATYMRTVQNTCTGGAVLVGISGSDQKVAVYPGVRAIVEITTDGARMVADKPLDPRDFGCKFDGFTDDLPAFQAMIDSFPTGDSLFPLEIELPAGRAWFSGPIRIRRPVIMRGKGGNFTANQSGHLVFTKHYNLYSTVLRFAPGRAGIIVDSNVTSGDGGWGFCSRFEDFEIESNVPILSTGVGGGQNILALDPTYDTRANLTEYEVGRLVLRAGATTNGSGTYMEGATRGGDTLALRVVTRGVTAAAPPAAIAAATLANIGDLIVDGTCTFEVESLAKDYVNGTSYVEGQKVVLPGDNLGVFTVTNPGTSMAAGVLNYSHVGIGVRCPDAMANALPNYVFDDSTPGGLEWTTDTPCGFVVMAQSTQIKNVSISGFMGYGVYVTTDSQEGYSYANWVHLRDYLIMHCGGGVRFRGTDSNGALNENGNFMFLGAGRTNVDAASYLNLGTAPPTNGKWGNGGAAILDRSLSGAMHVNCYSQFSNAPAWRNDTLTPGAGFAAVFIRCLGETVFSSIFRGSTMYAIATEPVVVQTPPTEVGGLVIHPVYGRGLREVDLNGWSVKRMTSGLMNQSGTGGAHWFQTIDEFSGCQFGWNYQDSTHDGLTAGTGWYTFGVSPFYRRFAFGVSGTRSQEGLAHFRFYKGFFEGTGANPTYNGYSTEKTSLYIRGGRRFVGDRFRLDNVGAGQYTMELCSVAGYHGKPWASFSGLNAVVSASPTSPWQLDEVSIPADHYEEAGTNKVYRVVAKTGNGLHPVAAPDLSAAVNPNDEVVVNNGTGGTVTYRYLGLTPTYVQLGYIGAGGGEANTASNVGGGTGLFKQKTGVNLEFLTLAAGSNITLTPVGDTIEIAAAGGAGEANTGSNVGVGTGEVFKDKSGVDLRFRTIVGFGTVDATTSANEVTIQLIMPGSSGQLLYNNGGSMDATSWKIASGDLVGPSAEFLKFRNNANNADSIFGVGTNSSDWLLIGDSTNPSITVINSGTYVAYRGTTHYFQPNNGSTDWAIITATEAAFAVPVQGHGNLPLHFKEASIAAASSVDIRSTGNAEAYHLHLTGDMGDAAWELVLPSTSSAGYWIRNDANGNALIRRSVGGGTDCTVLKNTMRYVANIGGQYRAND